ncbi:hypothetical protein [Halomonas cupida]|uniref:hypothetical protein n=1 Tax=Halomonas cupida TaxID=44933 RepID=UPI003A938C0E
MSLQRLLVISLLVLISGCSNYQYKTYAVDVGDPAISVLDLSDGTADAPVVYFDTVRYRSLGIPFHRLLLATRADGERLPFAGKRSILDYSGYQAIRMNPGQHSLEWCWVSMNALGSGGGTCGFGVSDLDLEAGKNYLVTWSAATKIEGTLERQQTTIRINSFIIDRDKQEQVYP